jgi:hypothetical protein
MSASTSYHSHLPLRSIIPGLIKPFPRSTTRTCGQALAHSDDLRFVPSAASRRWNVALIEGDSLLASFFNDFSGGIVGVASGREIRVRRPRHFGALP